MTNFFLRAVAITQPSLTLPGFSTLAVAMAFGATTSAALIHLGAARRAFTWTQFGVASNRAAMKDSLISSSMVVSSRSLSSMVTVGTSVLTNNWSSTASRITQLNSSSFESFWSSMSRFPSLVLRFLPTLDPTSSGLRRSRILPLLPDDDPFVLADAEFLALPIEPSGVLPATIFFEAFASAPLPASSLYPICFGRPL